MDFTDEQVDAAARHLRETLQATKKLTPWESTPKPTKKKWVDLARGTLAATAMHGVAHSGDDGENHLKARVALLEAVIEPFAARCDEAVRPDDADNDGVTVKTVHLRRARAVRADPVDIAEAQVDAVAVAIQNLIPGWLAEDGTVEDRDLAIGAIEAANGPGYLDLIGKGQAGAQVKLGG